MTHRRQHTQAVAAAKAGISERSARRIENDPQLPSQKKKERHWRTRADPLEPFWPRVEELLQIDGIIAVTVFETLQDEFGEDAVPDAIRRTLERRIARWRALHGGEKEIFFPQHHEPGRQGLSDFTVCDSLKVTVAGETLAYRLYHFRLAASGWEHAAVVLGGESFAALSEHLQDALWKLGGAPAEHRSDSLSAAYKNLDADAQRDFTRSYDELCRHYGMLATRNNRGEAHENGSIEGPHAHLKRRLDQALRRRGSRDFVSIEAWREFVEAQVARQNRRHATRIDAERRVLKALPARRTTDFAMVTVDVTRNGTVAIDRVTLPSICGHRLGKFAGSALPVAVAVAVAALAASAAHAGADTTFAPALAKFTDFLEGSGGKIITVLSLAGGLIGLASGRFTLAQIAVPVGVGIGVGTGVPIVTSVVTAVI